MVLEVDIMPNAKVSGVPPHGTLTKLEDNK